MVVEDEEGKYVDCKYNARLLWFCNGKGIYICLTEQGGWSDGFVSNY